MFSTSPKSRLIWREQTGMGIKMYSATRWWSKWECMKQVLELWGDVLTFLSQILSAKVSPKSCEKLQLLLLTNSNNLQIELAAVVDAGEPFVKATYKLEGDGPLALECYEILGVVKAAIQVNHLPNTTAIAKKIASTGQTEQFWMDYAKRCTQPAFDYFHSKFDVDVPPAVNAFKSACLFQPSKISNLKPDALSVESLRSFPFPR